jgi:outer membrane protein assembly factor BamA
VSYGIPISETDTINLGLRFENTSLSLFDNSPLYYRLYIAEFGSTTNSVIVSAGWARDTRDDILYPTKGVLQVAGVEVGLPIVDLAYYKANYLLQWFWPVYGEYVLMLRGDVGYAAGYSGKPLPFYKVFYGGGVGSVRGLRNGHPRTARPRRKSSRRRAQDHRQCGAFLSCPQRRQVGAGERVLRCGPDLRRSRLGRRRRQPGKDQ